ncbi:hypothetical protein H257_11285 [Aphanomyces astaci]|uniref:Uncharacterized protein n=1 Tax=Aphanomyces astaci TaxID=112090 RepID=W4G2Q6_APHAT|nr:hypothetical protein H257_11285 [Aphanomyces astaci]ETV73970.1 hypothetical protein H257_11285 [Aphanomyces astaci]|eukprot:XP_009836483.1 hypothetical protein H257_11285 [Aphanomyces astaci]
MDESSNDNPEGDHTTAPSGMPGADESGNQPATAWARAQGFTVSRTGENFSEKPPTLFTVDEKQLEPDEIDRVVVLGRFNLPVSKVREIMDALYPERMFCPRLLSRLKDRGRVLHLGPEVDSMGRFFEMGYGMKATGGVFHVNLTTTLQFKSVDMQAMKRNETQSQRADSKARTCHRSVKLPEVEAQTLAWVLCCEELDLCVTGKQWQSHNNWLCRHRVKILLEGLAAQISTKAWTHQQNLTWRSCFHAACGASTPLEAVSVGRQQILQETSGYNPQDIYNMDTETSFFNCLAPHRSITRNRVPGTEK